MLSFLGFQSRPGAQVRILVVTEGDMARNAVFLGL